MWREVSRGGVEFEDDHPTTMLGSFLKSVVEAMHALSWHHRLNFDSEFRSAMAYIREIRIDMTLAAFSMLTVERCLPV